MNYLCRLGMALSVLAAGPICAEEKVVAQSPAWADSRIPSMPWSGATLPHGPDETKGDGVETPDPAERPSGKIVGWRGDGTGHYPDASPPTTWMRNEKGEKKNILWETKLPCYTWSTPIIVGDRIFTRAEPYDLICLDKMTGKILWIRSHPPVSALSAEEKRANPDFAVVETLIAELQKANDEFAAQGWTPELYQKKYDLKTQINEMTAKIGKRYKLPNDQYVESWAGHTGQQPWSDGQSVYLTSGVGVTACYDLQGNQKWAAYEPLPTGEHGHGWSPALFEDKFLVPRYSIKYQFEIEALNKATGKTVWRLPFEKGTETWNMSQFKLNGVEYGGMFGYFFRVSDGKSIPLNGHCTQTVRHEDLLYSVHNVGQVTWFKVAPDLKVTLLTPGNKEGYQELCIPPEDGGARDNTFSNFYTAAPLVHNGLVYVLSNWGRLSVVDAAKAEIVYTKKLPFDFRNPQSRKTFGCGIGASPALAGKYVYMIDSAGCTIVMEPGRTYKQVAKNNIDEIVPHAWEPKHWMGEHHEQTEATPIFDANRMYIRGEQYLYCIAEGKK